MERSHECFLVGGEYSSSRAQVCIPCCQHLPWWVGGWASDNLSKVGHLPDYYCVFRRWDIEECFSDLFV